MEFSFERAVKEPCRTPACEARIRDSIETEAHFHFDLHVDRVAIFHRGLKTPLLHGFDRLLIESESQAANNANIARSSLVIDNHPKHACPLSFGVTRRLRVHRIRR